MVIRLVILMLVCCVAGCSGSSAELADARQQAYQAIEEGDAAFDQGDYAAAAERFSFALEAGAINVDSRINVMLRRVLCYAMADRFDEAHAELDLLEANAPNGDEICAARSFVYKRQGDARKSKAAWNEAKRLNRAVKPFEL
ncbi:MAG: tetratricopeptide repeat protein [Planctomycetales bacterium]|nr:tetratricopeptide repeat protein [Planctomycetales bacterium]